MNVNERSEVFPLADSIAYQDDAIVSRTIIKAKGGSVTLFAFDRGQELSEHTVPFDALVSVLDGEAEISIDGKPHAVTAGDAIVMPARHPHAVRAPSRFKMMLAMVRSDES